MTTTATTITFDNRERGLIAEFEGIAPSMVPRAITPLKLGDIVIENASTILIIERKTHNDLHSSLTGGARYNDQISRLIDFREAETSAGGKTVRVIYLLEKNKPGTKSRLTSAQLAGVQTSLVIKYGFFVINTAGLRATAEMMMGLYKKLAVISGKGQTQTKLRVMSAAKKMRKKSDYVDPAHIMAGTLLMIPSFGLKTVTRVVAKFDSFPSICKFVSESESPEVCGAWFKEHCGLNKRNIANIIQFASIPAACGPAET